MVLTFPAVMLPVVVVGYVDMAGMGVVELSSGCVAVGVMGCVGMVVVCYSLSLHTSGRLTCFGGTITQEKQEKT